MGACQSGGTPPDDYRGGHGRGGHHHDGPSSHSHSRRRSSRKERRPIMSVGVGPGSSNAASSGPAGTGGGRPPRAGGGGVASAMAGSGDNNNSGRRRSSDGRRQHTPPASAQSPPVPGDGAVDDEARRLLLLGGVIDPSDVRSGLDERLERTVNCAFRPTEILRIQRRVRSVASDVRSPSSSSDSGSGGDRTGGKSGGTIAGMVAGVAGRHGGGHGGGEKESRAALQRQAIDEYMMRRIFSVGSSAYVRGTDGWTRLKRRYVLAGRSVRTLTLQAGGGSASARAAGGDTSEASAATSSGDGSTTTPTTNGGGSPTKSGGFPFLQRNSGSHPNLEGNDHSAAAAITSPSHQGKHARPVDPMGSAHMVLLSASESRWDGYAAAAAAATDRVLAGGGKNPSPAGSSVSRPDLGKKSRSGGGGTGGRLRGMAGGLSNGSSHGHHHGDPTMDGSTHSSDGGGGGGGGATSLMADMDVPLPVGISFVGLCFGMGLALRGNRAQKLSVLFHILIPPKQLKPLFAQSNFFPSYIFELGYRGDGDGVVDASLSSSQSSGSDDKASTISGAGAGTLLSVASRDLHPDSVPLADVLRLDPRVALDAVGALMVASTLPSDGCDGDGNGSGNGGGWGKNEEEDGRRLASLIRDCTNPALLSQLLHRTTAVTGGPAHEGHGSGGMHWTYSDFVDWATRNLDDLTLDTVLETLFERGVLPSADEELAVVRSRWTEWFDNERWEHERWKRMQLREGGDQGSHEYRLENGVLSREEEKTAGGGGRGGVVDIGGSALGGAAPPSSVAHGGRKKFGGGIWHALSFATEHQHSSVSDGPPNGDDGGPSTPDNVLCSAAASGDVGGATGGTIMNGCGNGSTLGSIGGRLDPVWGGLGNFDNRGGLGFGIMYCVDKKWWDSWIDYSGWKSGGRAYAEELASPNKFPAATAANRRRRRRPPPLSNQSLLMDPSTRGESGGAISISGTLGSYEIMETSLEQGKDFILIPPGVFDVLFELYGGGPPLPRLVAPPTDGDELDARSPRAENDGVPDDAAQDGPFDEVAGSGKAAEPYDHTLFLPRKIRVITHPWVIQCQICDPLQPYRRGDVGSVSIRVQATPDQPFWRFFAELVLRLPVHSHPRIFQDKLENGGVGLAGRARLWRRLDGTAATASSGRAGAARGEVTASACRYGPWSLLCKGRHATFPVGVSMTTKLPPADYAEYEKSWRLYADHGSVESVGLFNGMRIMFEYAVTAKDGVPTWPREAAAKAGRARRLVEEDSMFRLTLRGLDAQGNPAAEPLVGMVVDAMDSTGRWYQAEIVQVDKRRRGHDDGGGGDVDEEDEDDDVEGDEEDDSTAAADYADESTIDEENDGAVANANASRFAENFRVRIDFGEMGFHEEWIDVDSDRLAIAGRYTLDSMKSLDITEQTLGSGSPAALDSKSRHSQGGRKLGTTTSNGIDVNAENGGATSLCPFPGYGACGLSNLGNTCYANAALQCVGYMPLIRAYLLAGLYKVNGDLNKDNPLGTGGRLLEELSDLLRVLWCGKYSSRAPTRFRNQLGKARSQFSGTDQQDAQELLNTIFDALHEDSNKVRKKPIVPPLEDSWVKTTSLPRVGLEAWRRFLRRNRSVVANVAMGQVLNRVTCPTCNHSSLNFDPFNMLSIPFPTVAEVTFRCRILRRGTAQNCSGIFVHSSKRRGRLNGSEKERSKQQGPAKSSTRSIDGGSMTPVPPSENLIMEEYIVAMSRLADVGDLKLRLQNLAGISAERLKLCKAEDIVVNSMMPPNDERGSNTRTYVKVTALPEKEGPCVQLANKNVTKNETTGAGSTVPPPTEIIAFESTLRPREQQEEHGEISDGVLTGDYEDEDEDTASSSNGHQQTRQPPRRSSFLHQLREDLSVYGDEQECRMVDTDPTFLSRVVSRSLWPRASSDFRLGLRVDAIDQRDHWFPGSVVEISDFNPAKPGDRTGEADGVIASRKVRVHFDNFSSRWDEWYEFADFESGQVQPLYSHATPRAKPTEVLVHHRHGSSRRRANNSPPGADGGSTSTSLFGQPFYIQFHNEWSTARAGAHILVQAARFLNPPPDHGRTSFKNKRSNSGRATGGSGQLPASSSSFRGLTDEERDKLEEAAATARAAIAEAIDILVESERQYIKLALSADSYMDGEAKGDGPNEKSPSGVTRNPGFDAASLTTELSDNLGSLLPRLPFDVLVCSSESPLGGVRTAGGNTSEEISFPFSLVRTVGNYLNSRHAIVLHWRNVRLDKIGRKSTSSSRIAVGPVDNDQSGMSSAVVYISPKLGLHAQSRALLDGASKSPSSASDAHNESSSSQNRGSPSQQHSQAGGMHLGVCLTEFCKEQQLSATDCWRCPKCKDVREGRQSMALWRLPDILTFHIKRFNCSARWREKISTKINFPLTGLNMSEWCDKESPALNHQRNGDESTLYDLIGVVNHLGGMTGGHYVAACKATPCGADGSEEVAHDFTGAGASSSVMDEAERSGDGGSSGVWRIPGRIKDKDASVAAQQSRAAAMAASKAASESCEPLWLQFDDDLVEPIPPKNVVSEMAYVLFYRRRQLTSSNMARYCTLD